MRQVVRVGKEGKDQLHGERNPLRDFKVAGHCDHGIPWRFLKGGERYRSGFRCFLQCDVAIASLAARADAGCLKTTVVTNSMINP